MGDVTNRDAAGRDIYNIVASVDALAEVLHANLERIDARVMALERAEIQHANERQALTRALMVMANESTSVRAVQRQLDEQLISERSERGRRRRQLDGILMALVAVNAAGIVVRLIRRPSCV